MRRAVTRKLLQGQDICFFCAFRHGLESRAANPIRPQRRLYRAVTPSRHPAGTAAARIEEEDDDVASPSSSSRELVGWKCGCNHVNTSRRSECTICLRPRPQKPELVYRDLHPSPPPPSMPPPQAPPLNTAFKSAGLSPPPTIASRAHSVPPERVGTGPRFDSQRNFGQQSTDEQRTSPRSASQRATTTARNGQNIPSWRDRNPDRPLIRYSVWKHSRNTPEEQKSQDVTAADGAEKASDVFSRLSSVRQPLRPRNGASWNENGIPVDSRRIGSPIGRNRHLVESSFENMPTRQEPTVQRSLDSTGTRDGFQQWFPMSGLGSQDQRQESLAKGRVDPRSRRDGFQRGPGSAGSGQLPPRIPPAGPGRTGRGASTKYDDQPQQEATSADEIAELSMPVLAEDAGDKRHVRKAMSDKEIDRRSRIYDIEDSEEPMPASRTPRSSAGKRRSINRMNTPDFDPDLADELFDQERSRKHKGKKRQPRQPSRPEIVLPEFISVEKLAQGLKVRLPEFLEKLEEEGFEGARYDHILDSGTSAMFAEIYGFEPIVKTIDDTGDLVARPPAEDPSSLPPRPPVVTIMGHVDHGKTTILDYFRKANVVASEHGGITQHIGAFSVTMPGSERNITFLDTPGHAAFLEMRRRGAIVTDIVVLVVAADDSVKAQTIEAIKHAQEAGVQIIVAINKIDKEGANIERVKQDLVQHDIVVEDFGGDYQAIPVSGKTGRGMDDLEEAILALADVADFRAEVDGLAEGWIIESRIGATGRVATVLVRRGTLRPGDFIVAGTTWARVRTLRNDAGQLIDEAPPGTPVQIDGWRGSDPMAGLEVLQAEDEQQAKEAIAVRQEREETAREIDNMSTINNVRAEEAEARAKVLEWEREQGYQSMGYKRRPKDNEGWVERESSGPQLVHFVIKADVAGSTEALVAAVSAIGNKEIRANIIHSGTGPLTESDIRLLAATGEVGYAISFNQPVDNDIRQTATAARLQILDHNIIYKVTDDVKEKVGAELPPLVTQRVVGEAEVGDIFEIKLKKGTLRIAGCRVTNGTVRRSEKIRVLRNGEVLYTGMLNSFKNIKKDVTEMRKGSECGMGFENWEAFEVGDQIQSFEEITEKRPFYC